MRTILSELLGGDEVAAEYVLLNLVSKYYMLKDLILFDNFPLNLVGLSEMDEVEGSNATCVADELVRLVGLLKEYAFAMPFSLGFLNSTLAIPVKNYDKLVLDTGFLQQANGSSFLINEVHFEEGQIN